MEYLKHFSHEHLLILVKGERDEIVRKSVCYGCQTPILAEPTYSCGKCSFFLHKRCAELPKDISHAMHPQHRLILIDKPPYSGGSCFCNGRQQMWRNFTYHYNPCAFDLDIICVTIEDRKLKHPSHVHALTFKNQRATFRCHACGNIEKDMSYSCTSYPYWITTYLLSHTLCHFLSHFLVY
nr:uncharacterized protein LOC113692145 [Coffea arabica]